MGEVWRLMEDGPGDGRMNMAADQAILIACGQGKSPPTLRCYGWNRPTLTIGYSQDPRRDLNLERCREYGIPVVVRPTGGRSLLHHHEFTYSMVAPIPHPSFPSNLRGTFETLSRALLFSLRQLGIEEAEVAPEKTPSGFSKKPGSKVRSPSCFAALNHWEISAGNRKLVGSAQRRLNRSFLQQGSVWIDCDREFMNSLFRFESPEDGRMSLDLHKTHTITLNELCGKLFTWQEVSHAFREGFEQVFPVTWSNGGLTDYEKELCAHLTEKLESCP